MEEERRQREREGGGGVREGGFAYLAEVVARGE